MQYDAESPTMTAFVVMGVTVPYLRIKDEVTLALIVICDVYCKTNRFELAKLIFY